MMFSKRKQGGTSPSSFKSAEDVNTPKKMSIPVEDGEKGSQAHASVSTAANDDTVYPSGLKLGLLLTSVFTSMFLVTLDRLIITTAIPQITNDFNSVTDIGWYGSAYFLTTCAFQLLFGKIYSLFNIKTTFLSTIFLFEIGSAVCGAAPTSIAFIVGRAIAGLGSAGIYSGVIVVIMHSVPLHKRPVYQGMFGAIFGLSSVIGPLLGGVFTSKVSWRWCFYLNLPLGGVAMVVVFFLLNIPDKDSTNMPIKSKLARLDVLGTSVIIPGSIFIVLALQWGGLTYAWNSGRIITLLVLGSVLLLCFVLVQIFLPKTATIAPRIFLQRSIFAGAFSSLCIGSQMNIFVYYLPVWFQAIQGVSAIESGIRLLPLIISMVISSILTGALVRRIGYYTPFMIFGVCLMSVGAGLLNTLQTDTPLAKLIGYQILYGWGIGCVSQAPNLAAQTVLPKQDISIGTSLMFFSQLLGGAVFISVGQNVLSNQLLMRLSPLPGFSPEMIQDSGATSLTNIPEAIKPAVVDAYNESLRHVFMVGLILVCVSILGALAMEWRSVKENTNLKKQQAVTADAKDVTRASSSGKEERGKVESV